MHQLDRLDGGGVAVGHVDDVEVRDVKPEIFRAGPTKMGAMIRAAAASTAPRSDVSSHGCTTMVVAGGKACARAIKRSYLLSGARAAAPIAARGVIPPSSSVRMFEPRSLR